MKSNYIEYDFKKSRERVSDILDSNDNSYEEVDSIPSRDRLTFTNGFYIKHTVSLFVDIRSSSDLPQKYTRPILAKIYRSYISEVVAIMNSDENCAEVNIQGDSVWGVFDGQYKSNIDTIFSTAARISSIVDYLNCQYKKKKIEPIVIGMGMAHGRSLMIKAGYNGSAINDVVWMGDVVNEGSKLCTYGNNTSSDYELMCSNTIHDNLKEENKKLLTWNATRQCYHGNIINVLMNKWIEENC